MGDSQRPWETAGARVDVSLGIDRVLVVVARPDGSAPVSFESTESEFLRLGPAIISPIVCASLGQWLVDRLSDSSTVATWRLVASTGSAFDVSIAGGIARVMQVEAGQLHSVSQVRTASQFRHDVRNLLNAIGMNADLAGVLGGNNDDHGVKEAAARIRRSTTTLEALVSSWTAELEADGSTGQVPVVAAVIDALRRAGVAASFDARSDASGHASVLWCFAANRLLIEWLSWVDRAEHSPVSAKPGQDYGLVLECGSTCVNLSQEGLQLSAGSPAFELIRKNAAAPELELLEPTSVLGGASVGFGSWQNDGAAGVCIGIPLANQ